MDEIEADKIQSPTAPLRNTASDANSKAEQSEIPVNL
jgi:hypothetical protein